MYFIYMFNMFSRATDNDNRQSTSTLINSIDLSILSLVHLNCDFRKRVFTIWKRDTEIKSVNNHVDDILLVNRKGRVKFSIEAKEYETKGIFYRYWEIN